MGSNFLKIAFRIIARHKVFSAINIFGLAVGMASAIFILLWVEDELSFDNFLKDARNIYLVLRQDAGETMAVSSTLLAPSLKEDLPEVADATNIMPLPESFEILLQNGTIGFNERIGIAQPNFFEMFSFKFKDGNPATALAGPNSMVLTEAMGKKYFGEEKPVGKTLDVSAFGIKRAVTVTGVLENLPPNSNFRTEVILPFEWLQSLGLKNFRSWDDQSVHTYIRLKPGGGIDGIPAKIKECEVKNFPGQNTQKLSYSLLPLLQVHLYGGVTKYLAATGDIKYVRIFIAIALVILLIAGINYMNLSTALSLKRTKEIGIKKTIGANRSTLVLQYFSESVLLSCMAACLAVLAVGLLLPQFNALSGKTLTVNFLDPQFLLTVVLIALGTGILSGCYPALLLSSLEPMTILKERVRLGPGSLNIRKALLVFQFALSIILISCTIVVFNQLSFIRNTDIGMEKDNIVCIKMPGEANGAFTAIKNRLLQNPDILGFCRSEPMNSSSWTKSTGIAWRGKDPNQDRYFFVFHPDYGLVSAFNITMSRGRFYSEQYPSDRTNAYVVNEAAVRVMGLKSPLDEEIRVWGRSGKIIGVTKDFHFASFHTAVDPLIIRIPDSSMQNVMFRTLSIRFKAGTLRNSMESIGRIWKECVGNAPLNYYFYDESLDAQYRSEQRMGTIFEYFSLLSIIIACLGLFALASISAEQRTKEIGIRKVLGGSVLNVSFILSKEFLQWVLVSNFIAWPVAYYVAHVWLEDFAYRIDMTVWPFLSAGILALLIALLTVSWQTIRVARANPIESLKYE